MHHAPVIICKCACYTYLQKGAAYAHFTLRMWHDNRGSVEPEDGTVVQALIGKIVLSKWCKTEF